MLHLRASDGGVGFPRCFPHQLLNVVSKWTSRAFPTDIFIFCHSHLVNTHSDHGSKRQSFEEVPETFKCVTEGADETENVEGPQDQSSCKTHGKVVFISWNVCFHNMACGYLAS